MPRWPLLLVLPLLLHPVVVMANGGTLRVADVPMGAYRVSVFTDPTPVRPDSLDVSVLVLEEGREGTPDGLRVSVEAELLERHAEVETEAGSSAPSTRAMRATRDVAEDPRYYAAKFALDIEGRWRITVGVSGEAGQGETAFEVVARERGWLAHPLTVLLLGLLPLAAAAWWVMRNGDERPRPR